MRKSSLFFLAIFGYLAGNVTPLLAQISPDNTLPNNSVVISNSNRFKIEGGTFVGTNLFHSFQEFSLPTGKEAFFNNVSSIKNIISRVTGRSISHIDGLIRANGTANLFFLNPNGIIFGGNATLAIGGSFVASTASSLKFADGAEFNPVEPQKSILTVSVPIGLGFSSTSGTIQVLGTGYNIVEIPPINPFLVGSHKGLNVASGKTLALVGSNVILEGGILTAESGRIELGSVEKGTILFQQIPQGMALDYSNVTSFEDIQISSLALVDASGLVGGSIQIYGKRVAIDRGGLVLIRNLGPQPSGDIFVNAQESLRITGDVINPHSSSPFAVGRSSITTESLTEGKGGNINVFSQNLILQDGGVIGARGFGNASTGSINIQATQDLKILNFSPVNPRFFSGISAVTNGQGDSGDINIFSENILATNGGQISASTLGEGNGGNVNVNVQDSIRLIGVIPQIFLPSVIGTATLKSGTGGNLTINTSKLTLQDGARIDTSSYSRGRAGNITVTASDFIEVSGSVPGSINTTSISSSVSRADPVAQELFQLPQIPTGTSGSIMLNTPRLMIKDNALVTVSHTGIGNAGNLTINSSVLVLNNLAGINAATLLGEGGNLFINSSDLRLLAHSGISATGGGTGNGGNITINTNTLVGLENSDITANAFEGAGGKITIFTRGLFGLEVRDRLTHLNDITAFSQQNPALNGTVQIEILQPLQQELNVPKNTISTEQLLAASCLNRTETRGTFNYLGQSGLPLTPESGFDREGEAVKIPKLPVSQALRDEDSTVEPKSDRPWQIGDPIIEPNQVVKTSDGRTLLVTVPVPGSPESVKDLICSSASIQSGK
jgi:filamentous hemagglutinin family protein